MTMMSLFERGRTWPLEDKARLEVDKIADEGVASDGTFSSGTCVVLRVWKCRCS